MKWCGGLQDAPAMQRCTWCGGVGYASSPTATLIEDLIAELLFYIFDVQPAVHMKRCGASRVHHTTATLDFLLQKRLA